MTDEANWTLVRELREGVADFLGDLTESEWDAPSLCAGWRVRDVAGHLSIVTTITTWQMLAVAPGARFDPQRINTIIARRNGDRPTSAIVGAIRSSATQRKTARVLDPRNALFDIAVHSQDMAIPVGRAFPVPTEASRRGLDRVWEMGWPFHARKRLVGVTLRATDAVWRVGDGPLIEGPALALLLLLTGRTETARPLLSGTGLTRLSCSA